MTNEEFWRQKTLATQLLEVRQTARALEIALGLVAARPDSVAATAKPQATPRLTPQPTKLQGPKPQVVSADYGFLSPH